MHCKPRCGSNTCALPLPPPLPRTRIMSGRAGRGRVPTELSSSGARARTAALSRRLQQAPWGQSLFPRSSHEGRYPSQPFVERKGAASRPRSRSPPRASPSSRRGTDASLRRGCSLSLALAVSGPVSMTVTSVPRMGRRGSESRSETATVRTAAKCRRGRGRSEGTPTGVVRAWPDRPAVGPWGSSGSRPCCPSRPRRSAAASPSP